MGCRLDSDCFHMGFVSKFKSVDHCLYILTDAFVKYVCYVQRLKENCVTLYDRIRQVQSVNFLDCTGV